MGYYTDYDLSVHNDADITDKLREAVLGIDGGIFEEWIEGE